MDECNERMTEVRIDAKSEGMKNEVSIPEEVEKTKQVKEVSKTITKGKRLKKSQGPEKTPRKKLRKQVTPTEVKVPDDSKADKKSEKSEGSDAGEGTSKDDKQADKDDFMKPKTGTKRGKLRRNTLRQSKILRNSKFLRKRLHGGGKSFGKRRKELGVIVPPTIFLLGGNIKDPLNLNSLQDEEINRAMNAVTPKSSPLPTPKHRRGEVEVIIPQNLKDPLHLTSGTDDVEYLKLLGKKIRKRRKRKRGNSGSGSGKEESFEAKIPVEEPSASIEGAFVPPDTGVVPVAGKRESLTLAVKDKEAPKRRKMEGMDKIVSPVVPQPGAWKRGQPRGAVPPRKRRLAQTPKFNPRNERYQYGNYDRYYGYRNPHHEVDPRLQHFMQHPEMFVDKDVLDIGCNIGHISLCIARDLGARSVSGLDIDKHLIGIARKNVKHYVQVTQTPAYSNCPSTRMPTPRTPYHIAQDSPKQSTYLQLTQKSPYHPPMQTVPEESPIVQQSPRTQKSPFPQEKKSPYHPPVQRSPEEMVVKPVEANPSADPALDPSRPPTEPPSPTPVPGSPNPSGRPTSPICPSVLPTESPFHPSVVEPTQSPYHPSIGEPSPGPASTQSPCHSSQPSPVNPSNSGSPFQSSAATQESPIHPESPFNPQPSPLNQESPCYSITQQSPYHPMTLKSPFHRALLPSPSTLQSPFHAVESPSRRLEPLIPPKKPSNVSFFPVCMPILFGPLHLPGFTAPEDPVSPKTFPHNVNFVQGSYVLESDALLATETPQFDTILCLSVTKWIHLNWGDSGLKRAFRRMYAQLRPGGKLILEAQAWPSYHRKKNLTEQIYRNYLTIELTPDKFIGYLLSPQVGFTSVEEIGAPQHRSKGFRRPIHVLTKPGQTPSSCNTPVCYTPYAQRTCVRKPVYTSLGAEAFENEEEKK